MFSDIPIDDDEAMALKEGPQYLLFHLNSQLFGLRAKHVSEIVELPNITRVPWMQSSLKGVCNIRGSVVGVLDVSKRLVERDFTSSEKTALVIVSLEFEEIRHRVGIIVDEVLEIEVFEADDLQSPPKFGLAFDSKYIESMAHYKDEYVPILSLQNVVSIEELSILEEF